MNKILNKFLIGLLFVLGVIIVPTYKVEAAPTVTVTASSSNVDQDKGFTISWTSTGATSCSESGGRGGTGKTGSFSVPYINATTTYTVTCSTAFCSGTYAGSNCSSFATTQSKCESFANCTWQYVSGKYSCNPSGNNCGWLKDKNSCILGTFPQYPGCTWVNNTGTVSGSATVTLNPPPIDGLCSGPEPYICAIGTSIENASNITNWTWRCTGINAGATLSCSKAKPMSGTLTPLYSSCRIAPNASSCNVTLTWATTNPVGTSGITASGMTDVTGNSGSQTFTVPYSNRIFYLYNNAVKLATATADALCSSGTAAYNGYCRAPVQGGWSAWIDDYESIPCGKFIGLTRTRTCTNPTPAYGGADCSALDGGNSSQSYDQNTVCPLTPPITPTGLRVAPSSCGNNWLNIWWNDLNDANVTNYKVYRGGTTLVYNGSGLGFSDTGLTLGTAYSYTVNASNTGGTSANSGAVSGTVASSCTCANGATNPPTCTIFPTCPVPLTKNVTVACDLNTYGDAAISGLATRKLTKSAYPGCTFPALPVIPGNEYVSDNCVYPPSDCPAPLTQNITVTCDAKDGYAAISGLATRKLTKSAYPGCTFPALPVIPGNEYVSDTCVYPSTSGGLNASPCTILAGGSTCPVTLNWTVSNPVGTSTLRTPNVASSPFYTSTSGATYGTTSYTYTVSSAPSAATFYLLNNGISTSATSTVSCVSNYHWGGSSCVINIPTNTFTVNNATTATIFKGKSATLRWDSPLSTSCTGTGFDTGGVKSNQTGVIVSPLVTTTYTLSCTNGSGTSENTVIVKVINLKIEEN